MNDQKKRNRPNPATRRAPEHPRIQAKTKEVRVYVYRDQEYPAEADAQRAALTDLLSDLMFHNCDANDVARDLMQNLDTLRAIVGEHRTCADEYTDRYFVGYETHDGIQQIAGADFDSWQAAEEYRESCDRADAKVYGEYYS